MKNFFIDTNIIIDVIDYRLPFYTESAKIFDAGAKGHAKLYMSALSYSNIYYIARKTTSHQSCIEIMKNLSSLLTTVDVTTEIINSSIASGFNDFEDSIQYYTALSIKDIDAIITRNPKDFKLSKIPVLLPQDLIIDIK